MRQNLVSSSHADSLPVTAQSALIFAGATSLLSVPVGSPASPVVKTFYCVGFASLLTNLVACVVGWWMVDAASSLPTNARQLADSADPADGANSLPYLLFAQKRHPEREEKNAERLDAANSHHRTWLQSPDAQAQFLCDLGLQLRWPQMVLIWRVTSGSGVVFIAVQLCSTPSALICPFVASIDGCAAS